MKTTAFRPIISPLALCAGLVLGLILPCASPQRGSGAEPAQTPPQSKPAKEKPAAGRFDPYPAYLDQNSRALPIYQIYRKSQRQQNTSLNTIQRLKAQREAHEKMMKSMQNPFVVRPAATVGTPAKPAEGAVEKAPGTQSETTY